MIKKRILALLLAVITIMQLYVTALPVTAEGTDVTIDPSMIGAIVRFNTENQVYMYNSVTENSISSKTDRIYPSALPKTLKVVDAVINVGYDGTQTLFYRLGTVDGSANAILEKYSWVKAAYLELAPDPDAGLIKGQVDLTDGVNKIDDLTISAGQKEHVYTKLGSEIGDRATYSWQLLIDKENYEWADIYDYHYPYAVVTEALIMNVRDEEGNATMRCIVTEGDKKYVSNNVYVSIKQPLAFLSAIHNHASEASEATLDDQRAAIQAFHIIIDYVYLHENAVDKNLSGSTAANTFTITLPPGAALEDQHIASPPIAGYKPYVEWKEGDSTEGRITYGGKQLIPADTVYFEDQRDGIIITVYYVPQVVFYRVRHLKQNLQNDEYLEWKTVFHEGIADTSVADDLALDEVGFSSLYYEKTTPITSDGNTVVEIYYDRIYYLVNYNLGEGAFGVMPSLVRYGTSFMLGNPTRPGYNFEGWKLTSVKDSREEGAEELLTEVTRPTYQNYNVTQANSQITIAHNLVYDAIWTARDTDYTIIYWRENANDNGFSIWTTETAKGTAGATIDISNKRVPTGTTDRNYFTYNQALSDTTVTVKGDGTGAANVYYTRNVYHIVFRANTGNTNPHGATACRIAEHTHGTDCCSVEGCKHTGGTCQIEMYCTKEEHAHKPECNYRAVCGKVEHTAHNNECVRICGKEAHTHNNGCYTHDKLSCYTTRAGELNEVTGGYTGEINNPRSGRIYRYRIKNGSYQNYFYFNEKWYDLGTGDANNIKNNYGFSFTGQLSNPNKNGNSNYVTANVISTNDPNCLSCGKESHTHSDACLSCTLHTHTDACYTSDCHKIAHAHADGCYQSCIRYEHSHEGCTRYLYVLSAKYNADIAEDWPTATHVEKWKALGWLDSDIYYRRWVVGGNNWGTKRVDMTSDLCSTSTSKTMTLTLESYPSAGTNTVKYMFESLDQTPGDGKVLRPNDGLYYEENTRYTQSGLVNNTFVSKEILGMTNVAEGSTLYYRRNSYKLIFVNGNVEETSVNIKYEAPLTSQYYVPNIPSSYEEKSVVFAGWYTTQVCADGTEFDFSSGIMPANDVYLYAKWEPTSWDVEVYLDREQTIPLYSGTVPFNSMIAEPQYKEVQLAHEEYKDLIWEGWYYTDADGKEIRFDFSTMAIKTNYNGTKDPVTNEQYPTAIYAKWTSEVPIDYVVYYVVKNSDGTYTHVADPTVGVALVGIEKSFFAKAGDELYFEFRNDYLPLQRSTTHKMSEIASHNVVYFEYETVQTVEYTIKHVFKDSKFNAIVGSDTFELSWSYLGSIGSQAVYSSKIVVNFDAALYEHVMEHAQGAALWEIIENLSPNAYKQELILTSDYENIIVFEWEDHGEVFLYQVIHYFQKLNYKDLPAGEQYEPRFYQEFVGAFAGQTSATVTAKPVEIPGFVMKTLEKDLTKTFSKDNDNGSGNTLQAKIIEIYYDRDTFHYTVQHVYGGTVESETKTAIFEQEVTETAKTIAGYVISDAENEVQTVSINYEGQIISFYYVPQQVTFNYQVIGAIGGYLLRYQERVSIGSASEGSTPITSPGYIFIGWYLDAEATQKVHDSWVSADGTLNPVPAVEDANKMVTYYAKFAPFSLTIQNRFDAAVNPNPELDLADQAFIYHIQGIAGTDTAGVQLRVAVLAGNSREILALPIGNYYVTVESAWSWRYQEINGVSVDKAVGESEMIENISGMTWTFYFDGSNVMNVTYRVPGPDIVGTTQDNTYFFVTDNAYGTSNQLDD